MKLCGIRVDHPRIPLLANLWNLYALSEEDYKRDFTEIDQSDLSIALNDVETAIKELKKVKTLKAEKQHNPK